MAVPSQQPDEWSTQTIQKVLQEEVLRLKVQEILGDKPQETRLQRVLGHPLTNTFFLFVLTAVLGGLIAYGLQGWAERNKRAAELREVRRSGAEKVFREVSSSMDRRLYWSRRYQEALATTNRTAIENARPRLDSAIVEWNTSLNTNTAVLCIYYGPEISRFFSKVLSPTLDWYADMLHSSAAPADLEQMHLHLQEAIYELDLRLADRIRSGDLWNERDPSQRCRIPTEFNQLLPRR